MATPMAPIPPPILGGDAPKKGNCLKILGIFVLVMAVLVGSLIAWIFSMGSAPMKAADAFLKQITDHQVEQAYSSASLAFQKSLTKDDFAAFVQQYPILAEVKSSSFNSFSIENNFATVRGTITGTDGQVSPISMQLVNENSAWKVMNLDLNPPPEEESASTADTGSGNDTGSF